MKIRNPNEKADYRAVKAKTKQQTVAKSSVNEAERRFPSFVFPQDVDADDVADDDSHVATDYQYHSTDSTQNHQRRQDAFATASVFATAAIAIAPGHTYAHSNSPPYFPCYSQLECQILIWESHRLHI